MKRVYLAGPMAGCSYEEAVAWRKRFANMLPDDVLAVSPLRGYSQYMGKTDMIGTGGDANHAMRRAHGFVTRDRQDCATSDAIVFNLLKAKRITVGTCVEVGWVDAFRKPSILIMENPTDTFRNVHEHAFIRELCGYHVTTEEEAAQLVSIMLSDKYIIKHQG